ncbi:MAG: type I-B CRISPR-associated protein Cas5 [Armatimonadetes bacterium]|nr:type I-B CRISPR-associated protein Cas5 [Armatimonadota bacterium]
MNAVRIQIQSYTASFKVPGMMGYQLTVPVPPPSTIFGLIMAAQGREVTPEETWIGYRFHFEAVEEDLEKIIAFTEKGPVWEEKLGGINTVPITRQFLYGATLILYLPEGQIAESFRRPCYPLLLGRSQDVAYVASIQATSLDPVELSEVEGVLLPFPVPDPSLRSELFSLPTYLPPTVPRRPRAVRTFQAVVQRQTVKVPGLLFQDITDSDRLAVPIFTPEKMA